MPAVKFAQTAPLRPKYRVENFPPNEIHPTDSLNPSTIYHDFYGETPEIRGVIKKIEKLKNLDSPVFITGEAGTGKEKIASIIHRQSSRATGPFMALNCALESRATLESKLFGSKGLLEACSNGTLFLNEIGDLPIELQHKLLQALQTSTITPIGSEAPIRINTRVISASSKNLKSKIKTNDVSSNLYYKLSVFSLNIPPLRERKADIIPLAKMFAREFSFKYRTTLNPLSSRLENILSSYTWPGNIKELKSAIQRGVALADQGEVKAEDVLPELRQIFPESINKNISLDLRNIPYEKALDIFRKEYLEALLLKCDYNISEAARISKKNRMWVYRCAQKSGIRLHK